MLVLYSATSVFKVGGVLQVTDEFCLSCCRKGVKVPEAAMRMGVSQQLMR